MVKNIVTAGVILFFANVVNANVVKGEGEYRFGPDTPENLACNIAEERAKENAIANFVGEYIEVSNVENCKNENCDNTRKTSSEVSGKIKRIISKDRIVYPDKNHEVCQIDLKAEVEPFTNGTIFNVSGETYFKHGDVFTFSMYSNKVGNVYVYSTDGESYDMVYTTKILPERETKVPANGYKFQALLKNNSKIQKEQIVFVLTGIDLTERKSYSRIEFNEMIKNIPFSDRKVVYHNINIVR